MATIRPNDLPAAASVPGVSAIIVDTGSAVEKATPAQIVDSAIPLASQAEAEAGTDNSKRVTPLRVAQAIDALGVSAAALAATDPGDGAERVGFKQTGSGSVNRSVNSVLRERVLRVTDFGADPTGVSDSLAAIEACRDACLVSGGCMAFPQGSYLVSGTVELGYTRLHAWGEGRVVIQAGFDGGTIVSVDAGDSGLIYQSSLRNLIVRGNGSANQTGFYFRNAVHGAREDLRVRNVTKIAYHVIGDVLSTYRNCWSSVNHEGSGGEASPEYDMVVDGSAGITATAACLFENCVFENATVRGLDAIKMDSCRWIGGAAEGLTGVGAYIGANCRRNSFEQFYCEVNTGGDFVIAGHGNVFTNCEAYNLALTTWQFDVLAGAKTNRIEKCGVVNPSTGDRSTRIRIAATAEDTVVRDCDLYELTDAGTRTWLENWSDVVNKVKNGVAKYDGGAGGFLPRFAGADAAGDFLYDVREGYVSRVGRTVTYHASLRISGVNSGALGSAYLGGLPWAGEAAASGNPSAFGNVQQASGAGFGSGPYAIQQFGAFPIFNTLAGVAVAGADLTANSLIRASGSYVTA